ncbi:hypothetical protein Trydic_g12493, partial [Trypoxylus dichotomus]
SWTDFKYALKRKSAAIKLDLNRTGGAPQYSKHLTQLELQFLSVLGFSFAEGVEVPERGVSNTEVNNINIQPECPSVADQITPKRKCLQLDPNVLFQESLRMLENINSTIQQGFCSIVQAITTLTQAMQQGTQTLQEVWEGVHSTANTIENGMLQISNNISELL